MPKLPDTGIIATLGTDKKIQLPKPMLGKLGWDKSRVATRVIIELLGAGWLRVWHGSSAKQKLENAEAMVKETGDVPVLNAFRDRYRLVPFYPADGRIRLPKELYIVMSPKETEELVYIEIAGTCLEVFTMKARLDRVRRLRGRTDADLGALEPSDDDETSSSVE